MLWKLTTRNLVLIWALILYTPHILLYPSYTPELNVYLKHFFFFLVPSACNCAHSTSAIPGARRRTYCKSIWKYIVLVVCDPMVVPIIIGWYWQKVFFFFFSIFEEHGIPYSYLYIITKMPELMPGLHNHTWSAGIFLLWLWWCYLVPWKRLFTWMDEHKHHFNSWMCVEYLWPVYWCEPYSTQMTIVMIKVSSVFSAWCWHQLES